jgi:drug/metabolite transporter (DMT)-like permease
VATKRFQDPAQMQTPQPSMHLRNYLILIVMILAMPFGNVMLGEGMKHVGKLAIWPPGAAFLTGVHIFTSPFVLIGLGSLLTWFVSSMLVLSWADYSYVQPATSLGYGVTALLSWVLLGEHVTPLAWLGIAIICLGVFVVGRTNPQTSAHKAAAAQLRSADSAGAN